MRAVLPCARAPRSSPAYAADSLLALVLGVPTVAGLVADEALEASRWLIGPLAALTALPIAVRRYWPLAVFVVTVAAWLAVLLAGVDTFAPGVLVATYTLAAHCERRVAFRAGVGALLLLAPASALSSGRFHAEAAIPTVVALGGGVDPRRQPAHAACLLPRARGESGAARA